MVFLVYALKLVYLELTVDLTKRAAAAGPTFCSLRGIVPLLCPAWQFVSILVHAQCIEQHCTSDRTPNEIALKTSTAINPLFSLRSENSQSPDRTWQTWRAIKWLRSATNPLLCNLVIAKKQHKKTQEVGRNSFFELYY